MLNNNDCPVLAEAKAFYKSKFGDGCISIFEVTSPDYKNFRIVFDIDIEEKTSIDDIKKFYDQIIKLVC